MNSKKYVSVFCASKRGNNSKFFKEATNLGRELNKYEFNLVFGGTDTGLMKDVVDGFLENPGKNKGEIIGVILPEMRNLPEITKDISLIEVSTFDQRKEKMLQLSFASIILPGGVGTLDELTRALEEQTINAYKKKNINIILLFNIDHFYDALLQQFQRYILDGFSLSDRFDNLHISSDITSIIKILTNVKDKFDN
jgi:hypothetical protein